MIIFSGDGADFRRSDFVWDSDRYFMKFWFLTDRKVCYTTSTWMCIFVKIDILLKIVPASPKSAKIKNSGTIIIVENFLGSILSQLSKNMSHQFSSHNFNLHQSYLNFIYSDKYGFEREVHFYGADFAREFSLYPCPYL